MRVIHSDLKLFPYKVQILQTQSQANKNQRYELCQSIICSDRIENNPLCTAKTKLDLKRSWERTVEG